jgi:hypothetical protein
MANMDDLDKMMERKMMRRQRGGFWYVTGSSPDTKGRMKQFLLGPFSDYETAVNVIERKRLTSAQPVEVNSSDLARAGQIIKAMRLQGNSTMAQVFDRVAHKNVGGRDAI